VNTNQININIQSEELERINDSIISSVGAFRQQAASLATRANATKGGTDVNSEVFGGQSAAAELSMTKNALKSLEGQLKNNSILYTQREEYV
jgi:hypothetical protein